MSKITVYYWAEYKIGNSSFQHVALKTPTEYYSFCPDCTEEKGRLSSIQRGQYMQEQGDIKNGGTPDKVDIILDAKAVNTAISVLKSHNTSWKCWKIKQTDPGFNAATAVLLLLKMGGLAKKLDPADYKRSNGVYNDRSLEELFKENKLENFDEFGSFAQKINEHISPHEVWLLAEASKFQNRAWVRYIPPAMSTVSFAYCFFDFVIASSNVSVNHSRDRSLVPLTISAAGAVYCVFKFFTSSSNDLSHSHNRSWLKYLPPTISVAGGAVYFFQSHTLPASQNGLGHYTRMSPGMGF